MNLKQVVTAAFIIVAVLGSFTGTSIFYSKSSQLLKSEVSNHLETTAVSRANNIEILLEKYKELISITIEDPDLKILLSKTKKDEDYNLWLEDVGEDLDSNIDIYKGVKKIFILDKDSTVVYSTEKSEIDSVKENMIKEIIAEGKYLSSTYLSEKNNIPCFSVGFPAYSSSGDVLGAVVMEITIDELTQIASEKTGLKQTGDVYLADSEGYMITPARFIKENKNFMEQKVGEEVLKNISESNYDKEHKIIVYKDYRDVNVFGTHIRIENTGWVLVVEIDESEALGEFRKELMKTSLMIIVLISLLVGTAGYVLSIKISEPIKNLTKKVDRITKGDFDVELKENRIDEIDSLTNSLNRILASMKLAILKTGAKKEDIGIGTKKALEAKKRAEKKMKESEERYKFLYEKASNLNCVIDPKGNVVNINQSFIKKLGYKKDDIIGSPISKLVTEEDRKKAMKALEKGFKDSKNSPEMEFNLLTKKGKKIPVLFSKGHEILYEKGKKQSMLITGIDISEKKKAEKEAEKRLKKLERFAKLAEGREEKMIELKKKIKELESKMKKGKTKKTNQKTKRKTKKTNQKNKK
ncbi:PAS domain S-box protein [Candidatus Woesearchaeota archaeon]|nr:PAS domain S-box protein [Candidatus Woesearchaeota archaeon]